MPLFCFYFLVKFVEMIMSGDDNCSNKNKDHIIQDFEWSDRHRDMG